MAPCSNSEATHQAPSPSHPYKRSTPQMCSIYRTSEGWMYGAQGSAKAVEDYQPLRPFSPTSRPEKTE